MNQLIRFGIILGAICLASTLVLAVTYEVTKPKIEEAARREETAALKEVMSAADSFEPKTVDGMEYFVAMKDGQVLGYCLKVMGAGYGGYIRIITGIDKDGIIKGMRVLEHQETPGLGSQISEVKNGEKDPWFLRQFQGKDARAIEVRKNIDAITGATISSVAVTDAVRKTADEFLKKVRE
ncbi:MAG: RnfABCDGE type electron transport complex subunit G [Candidatus Omnitrophica bacterium]|nr:RnfABCDGE type electron transport complex subunit G [Candidatus Omnitrophota bacterium]